MARRKRVKQDELVEPENDGGFERDWVNDPMWLRDVLHRVFDVLPKDLSEVVKKSDAASAAAVLTDVEYIFHEERERGYLVPSSGGPDDEDEDDEDDEDDGDEDEDDDDDDDDGD